MRTQNKGTRSSHSRITTIAIAVASSFAMTPEDEENFVGDSEIIALGGASNETKDRPLG